MQQRGKLTRRKLEEAEFFLSQLRPNYNKDRKFDFYLSAFISAARSVPWVMRAEYGKVPGWRSWYESQKPDPGIARLLKGTNDVRVRTQKIGALKTITQVKVGGLSHPNGDQDLADSILQRAAREGIPAKIGGSSGKYALEIVIEGEPVVLSATKVFFERKLEEFPEESILAVCDTYYDTVAALVSKCEEKF